ncbi:hypothetical protein SAMN05660485_02711 [Blastococcus fimeti]|nr:hypothetical protein SAMN05660485_02711 [Blastococcus fimeti]
MPVRSRPAQPVLTTAGACALLLLTSGCGLSSARVDSADPGPATISSPAPPAAAPTTAAEEVAAVELAGIPPYGLPASLRVSVSPAAPGVPPLAVPGGLFSAVCGVPDDAARYATISITFTDRGPDRGKQRSGSSNLQADVTVEGGGSGIGVFERSDAERSDDAAGYCPGTLSGGTSMQTEELSESHQTMTLYAVAPATAATPDPFRGSTVRIDGLRVTENSISTQPWTWVVESVTEGSACPDDPNALCLPLG